AARPSVSPLYWLNGSRPRGQGINYGLYLSITIFAMASSYRVLFLSLCLRYGDIGQAPGSDIFNGISLDIACWKLPWKHYDNAEGHFTLPHDHLIRLCRISNW